MAKWQKRALGAALAAAALAGQAQAQSNALGGGAAGPAGATKDLSAAIANGYAPFHLGAFEEYLRRASFTIGSRQATADGSGLGIVVAAPNGMPFLFIFSDCGRQGCMFMEGVQPFAPGKLGMPFGLSDVNAYNQGTPLHIMMTLEREGEVGLRWTMPALAGCEQACVNSAVNLYFGGVQALYQSFIDASKQMLVEAPYDDGEGVRLDFAALAERAAPTLQADAKWGAASAAFGEGGLTFEAVSPSAVRERLEAELERATEAAKPGATDFPALLGR